MADVSVTPANVKFASKQVRILFVEVGEAVSQGQPGYRNADGKHYQADGNASAEAAAAEGIFMTPAATDGIAILALRGEIEIGGTLAESESYVVSANKGGIAPIGDLASGTYVTHLGTAKSSTVLNLQPRATGIQVP